MTKKLSTIVYRIAPDGRRTDLSFQRVDDAVQREPLEMLAETMLIIFSAVLIYYTTGQAVKMKRSR